MPCRSARSIFGLPLLNPLARWYKTWTSFIFLLDLVYTAFLIPMLVAFEVPDIGWGWGCIINLVAGGLADIILWSLLMSAGAT